MKNLITKALGIAGITALSFLPMKDARGQAVRYEKDTIIMGREAFKLKIPLEEQNINYSYLFISKKDNSCCDEVRYSTFLENGIKIILKDSLFDNRLDYFSYTKEGHKPIILKNNTEIENATKEKDRVSKKEIYRWRDSFEKLAEYSKKSFIVIKE